MVPEEELRIVEATFEDTRSSVMWTGSVKRVQIKCWSETGERFEPIIFIAVVELISRNISVKDMLCSQITWQW